MIYFFGDTALRTLLIVFKSKGFRFRIEAIREASQNTLAR
jgi:hypothetical protein